MQTVDALNTLKQSVADDNFEFVPRTNHNKSPVTSTIAKIIVSNLSLSDFSRKDIDHDGSGDYIWVFIADDGTKYYIKFKILHQNRIKFISFHEAEY